MADARQAAKELRDRARRARDLRPALKVYAEWMRKKIDDDLSKAQESDGKPFPPLADSTIESRIRSAGGYKRGKSGKLTSGARKKSAAMREPGGIKPLSKTGRARNSQRAVPDGKQALQWSAVGYLGYHITGSEKVVNRPPRRNPTVFEGVNEKARLQDDARARLNGVVSEYIMSGKIISP